ncbi:MAG: acyltransferase [Proteobacteria bacterium]|nr:acyltransferase [Pseudomonadota bacterium]MBU4037698.1 acyltransferase [Pseudomonadota bacterium]
MKKSFYRRAGVKIGNGGMISLSAKLDVRREKVIIGDNCTITSGCVILSHDATAKRLDPLDDGAGEIIIEDNVFIGVNSVILRNVRIGKNSIIGAGSLVSKNVPSNVIVVGNPARVLRNI